MTNNSKNYFPLFVEYNKDKNSRATKDQNFWNENYHKFEMFLSNNFNLGLKELIEKKFLNKLFMSSFIDVLNQLGDFISQNNEVITQIMEEEEIKQKLIGTNITNDKNSGFKSKSNDTKNLVISSLNNKNLNIVNNEATINSRQSTKSVNKSFFRRKSCHLIGLKCKLNNRLSMAQSEDNRASPILKLNNFQKGNAIMSNSIRLNSSEQLSSIHECDSVNNKKGGGTVITKKKQLIDFLEMPKEDSFVSEHKLIKMRRKKMSKVKFPLGDENDIDIILNKLCSVNKKMSEDSSEKVPNSFQDLI